jgi:hypothetical protein
MLLRGPSARHGLASGTNPGGIGWFFKRILTSAYQRIKLLLMRTTITLDDDVYQAAAHLSRVSGKRLGKVISRLARRGLARHETPVRRKSRRFPSFPVPAGAPVIPASRIQHIIDEEGLF